MAWAGQESSSISDRWLQWVFQFACVPKTVVHPTDVDSAECNSDIKYSRVMGAYEFTVKKVLWLLFLFLKDRCFLPIPCNCRLYCKAAVWWESLKISKLYLRVTPTAIKRFLEFTFYLCAFKAISRMPSTAFRGPQADDGDSSWITARKVSMVPGHAGGLPTSPEWDRRQERVSTNWKHKSLQHRGMQERQRQFLHLL